ncbi:MAG: hypothetical protein HeimC3_50860 [Candidatus Heimdallarchaeota archaeon LC_3]|nr:MAG: hypothetical protein HeimC3_50860 [Candidatus Heimdallarchaeota archaeon LC_3]
MKKVYLINFVVIAIFILSSILNPVESKIINPSNKKTQINTTLNNFENNIVWQDDLGDAISNGSVLEGPNANVSAVLNDSYNNTELTLSNGTIHNFTKYFISNASSYKNYSIIFDVNTDYYIYLNWNYSKYIIDIYIFDENNIEIYGCNSNKYTCLSSREHFFGNATRFYFEKDFSLITKTSLYTVQVRFNASLVINSSIIYSNLVISNYEEYYKKNSSNSNKISLNTALADKNGLVNLTLKATKSNDTILTASIIINVINYFPPIIEEIFINKSKYINKVELKRTDIINLTWKIEDKNKDEVLISNLYYYYYGYNSWFVFDTFRDFFLTSSIVQFTDSLKFPSDTDLLIKLVVSDSFNYQTEKIIKFFIEGENNTGSENSSDRTSLDNSKIDTTAIPNFNFLTVLILSFLLVFIRRKYNN